MKFISKSIIYFFMLALTLVLTACGGGGGGGGGGSAPVAAAIDADNAEALSVAGLDATQEALVSQNANPFGVSISPDPATTAVSQAVANVVKQQMTLSGVVILNGDCGGTVDVPDPNALSGTMTFNDFCVFGGSLGNMVMNGSVTYSINDPMLSLTYSNFTVTFGGETITLSMSVTVNMNTGEVTWSSSFVGSDGASLTYSNFEISGDPSTGITVMSGRVTYSGVGYVDIYTTSPVVVGSCVNNRPMSGTIVAEGSNGTSASITFDTCTTYTWCYDLNDGAGQQCDAGTW